MNQPTRRLALTGLVSLGLSGSALAQARPRSTFPQTPRSRDAVARNAGRLEGVLSSLGLRLGDPVFIRITKDNERLEVFVRATNGSYQRFRSFDVCGMVNTPGLRVKRGDSQAPEGFYAITQAGLRPGSPNHLGLDIGYPNALDRLQARGGAGVAIQGGCSDSNAFAMTDPAIEEIYTIVEAALRRGQAAVPVHIFPFAMTASRLRREERSPWLKAWLNLQTGWELFEKTKRPPKAVARGGRYVITAG